ncbi:MAG: hypothetical protein ACRDP6_14880 [Actinoallomurus sp.]
MITDHDMPGWLTLNNALWCLTALTILAAACITLMYAGRHTGWDAPARDLADVTPAETTRWDIPRPAPVVWSDATTPSGWICAAPAAALPDGICGWSAIHGDCPDHGPLLTPAPDPSGATS